MTIQERTDELRRAMASLLDKYQDAAISASRPVNELLSIWALASGIDRSAAVPVEELLTALSGRQLTTQRELRDALDRVDLALATLPMPADA